MLHHNRRKSGMSELIVNLLGPPEAYCDNKPIKINRRIPRTLLYYLATQKYPIGRGKLASIFWQDTPPDIARRHLRVSLSRIRAEIPIKNLITNQNDLVGIEQDKLSTDLNKLRAITEETGSIPWDIPADQTLPDNSLTLLRHAINLWRGTQFLEGSELPNSIYLENWYYQTNLSLCQLRTRILTRISDHYYAAGQFEDSLLYAKLAVDSDQFDEDLHFRVLRLLVELANEQEARQYYLSITQFLKDELDVRPSQKLVSLFRQIQRNSQPSSRTEITNWRLHASIRAPFVGREKELSQLLFAMEKHHAMLITGESGIGKTRLVQEYCELYAPGSNIMTTRCRPTELNLPFQPIIELLRNNFSNADWQMLPQTWKESLSTILPEIRSQYKFQADPTKLISQYQDRSALFEAIRQAFIMKAKQSDLVLFIDDLHWSDADTLSAIAYLSERVPFTENGFMILAARSDESNPNLNELIIKNIAKSNLIPLELMKLSPSEISGLGRYVLGYPLDPDLVQQLEIETGGNPFIVLETLNSLKGQEKLSRHSGLLHQPKFPLTERVFSLIKNRLAQLSPIARETAEFAAVIGREFEPVLISNASGKPISIISRAIAELKLRHLIDSFEQTPQESRWRFVHEKIRETIINDTSKLRLQSLHVKVARVLESNAGPGLGNQAAVLARHYEYAGRYSTAFNYWLLAANYARELYSTDEALRIFTHAEILISRDGVNIPEDLIHDFYNEWTDLAQETGDSEQIRNQNNRLFELGQIRHSNLLLGTALVGLSTASFVQNELKQALEYINQAIPYLNTTENTYEKAFSQTNRGVYLYMLGRLNEAIESFEHALSIGGSENDPAVQRALANTHYHLSLSQTLAGWPKIGFNNAKISLKLANQVGHHHIAATAYLASSLALYFMADYDRASIYNEAGIEIAKKLRANRMLGYLYACKAFLENSKGNFDYGYALSEEILQIGDKFNYAELISLAHRIRGDIFLFLESYIQSLEEYKLGVKPGRNDFWSLDNLVRQGYLEVRTGQIEIGMNNLRRGINLAQSTGFGMVEIRGLQFLSFAYMASNDNQLTHQLTKKLEEAARLRNLPEVSVLANLMSISAGSKEKNHESKIELLEQSLMMLGDSGQISVQIRILLLILMLKRNFGLDTAYEVDRIGSILNHCAKYTVSPELIGASEKFQVRVKKLIST